MRRALIFLALCSLGCHRELPTEPMRETITANELQLPMIRVEPDPVVVAAGGEAHVVAKLTQDAFTYPSPVPLRSSNTSIATITGSIPTGEKSAVLSVRGIKPGECHVYYTLTNFPGGGHSAIAAYVTVTEPLPKPPLPVKAVTMSPNPVELKTGGETSVFVTLADAATSGVTFTSEARHVVHITGKVAAGRKAATVTVRGVTAGKTNILFDAGEKSGIAGRAIVEDPPPSRRRASRS